MDEPEKPFACNFENCGMTFTNEDHLHVHTKKHDMILQLGLEQKAAFVADQTPTPTRFIRNCEEVGLFQDLQNEGFTNPFDEGFKKAMESKSGILSLQNAIAADDVLHTPQMVFPVVDSGDSVYSTTNNHSNITISRSSSDESGTIKEYETTTISKQTNEVTTISRVIGKQDVDKTTTDDISIVTHQETGKEVNETVSYHNNVIKIHSNVEIRKDSNLVNIECSKNAPMNIISYTDSVIKDKIVTALSDSKLDSIPMMSQKSIDHVVDSLTAECVEKPKKVIKSVLRTEGECVKPKTEYEDDYEVIIKLPSGKRMLMKAVKDETDPVDSETKKKLKKILSEKAGKKVPIAQTKPAVNLEKVPTVLPIAGATLYPVTIVNSNNSILIKNPPQKVAIPLLPVKTEKVTPKKPVKNVKEKWKDNVPDCQSKTILAMRSAASKRYRVRLKEKMEKQAEDIKVLLELNRKIEVENKLLKLSINNHLKICNNGRDLKQVINERIPEAAKSISID